MGWDAKDVALLKKLWAAGQSAAQIARRLGYKQLGQLQWSKDRRQMKLRAMIGATALIGIGAFVLWTAFRVINAPSTEEAMRRSLAALEKPELEIAFALHPDACSITKVSIWKWSAACEGVPMHFYEEITVCDPGSPKICSAAPSPYENCRTFF